MYAKVLLATLLTAATVMLFGGYGSASHPLITRDEVEIYEAFGRWTHEYGKVYASEEERQFRFKRFSDNYVVIALHNLRYAAGKEQYDLGLNQFADLDRVEFKATYLGYKGTTVTKACSATVPPVPNPPSAVDWSAKGVVSAIKNQGQCGSCWAFSTVGSLEGLEALEKGKLTTLSEQQLVDCAGADYGNEGCNGGFMDSAMWYVIDNGITSEALYPYAGKNQKCAYKDTQKVYQIKNCAEVTANKTAALVEAVSNQPVAVAVEADQVGFQFYKTGVFNGKCGTNLDHGVLLVGFGTSGSTNYWKVKNSWGATWGSNGYILLAKNGDGPGQCGIQMENTVPLQSV